MDNQLYLPESTEQSNKQDTAYIIQKSGDIRQIIIVALSVLLALLMIGLTANLVRLAMVRNEHNELLRLQTSLSQTINELEEQNNFRQTHEFIERYAREELGMIGRDESAFVIMR